MEELVYHYTTLEAFYEMLRNIKWNKDSKKCFLSFWASSIYSMNDLQEFIYGYKLLQECILPDIEERLEIRDDKLKLSKIVSILGYNDIEDSNRILINYIYKEHNVPFIVSFTKNKDYLPMWNMYSKNGTGVCLGFNNCEYRIKDRDNIDILHRLHAMEVSYGEERDFIKNTVLSLYRKFYEQYRNDDDEKAQKQKMLRYFTDLALTISPYHKHEAYEFEKEMRLVQFKENESDVKYRISKRGRLIPYIEIPVKLEYLKKVIVGPCADSPSIIRELRNILKGYRGQEENFITSSGIPYREF